MSFPSYILYADTAVPPANGNIFAESNNVVLFTTSTIVAAKGELVLEAIVANML